MFYFENRQLKKEIERLEGEITEANEYAREKEHIINEQLNHVEKLKAKNDEIRMEREKAYARISELNGIVRDQTGADLLVNALKELGVIPAIKDEPQPNPFSEAERLQKQMAELRQSDQRGDFGGYGSGSGQSRGINSLLGGFF